MTDNDGTDDGEIGNLDELLGELDAMLEKERESNDETDNEQPELSDDEQSDLAAMVDLQGADDAIDGKDVFHWSAKALSMSKPLLIAMRTLDEDNPWRISIENVLELARAGDIVGMAQWAVECAKQAEPSDERDAETAEIALVAMLSIVLIAQEVVGATLITQQNIEPPQFSSN